MLGRGYAAESDRGLVGLGEPPATFGLELALEIP